MAHRVHRRDPQAVAHRRVRSTASPLAQDSVAGTKVDDLLHDEEVACEAEALDHPEFAIDRLPCPGVLRVRAVASTRSLVGAVCEPTVRGVPVGDLGARQARGDEAQVKSARGCDLARVVERLRVSTMQSLHLRG